MRKRWFAIPALPENDRRRRRLVRQREKRTEISVGGQARTNRIMLTQSALAARESFDQSRSFVATCEPQGMPTVMNWVYPFELSQRDPSTIILRSEYFDLERTIHMAASVVPAPAGVAPSRLGLSIGRFEDDGRSLVVETTALNWPYYDTIGTPLSPDVKITERCQGFGGSAQLRVQKIDKPQCHGHVPQQRHVHLPSGATDGAASSAWSTQPAPSVIRRKAGK